MGHKRSKSLNQQFWSFSTEHVGLTENLFGQCKGAYIKYVGRGGRRVLQIFRKNFRSPGDHRSKCFMSQQFFQKIFHGPSHQF